MRLTLPAVLLAIVSSGCGDRPQEAAKSSDMPTADAAGEIPFNAPAVVTAVAALDSVPTFRVDTANPITVIHASETDPNYEFHNTIEMVRLDNGTIVVAAAGEVLRFYDRAGKFVRSVGRKGDGPGEFRNILKIKRMRGDSIATFDLQQNRVSIFDSNGNFARSWLLPVRSGMVQPSLADDGTTLVPQQLRGQSTGRFRDRFKAVVVSPDAEEGNPIASFHGPWMFVSENSGGSVPFTSRPILTAAGNRFYITSGDTYDVMVFEGTRPLHRIHNTQPLRKVTQEDIDRFVSFRIEGADSASHQRYLAAVKDQAVEYHRAISNLIAAPDSTLWVATRARREDDFTTYHIYDHAGRLKATLPWVFDVSIREAGSNYVVVANYGESGLDRIEVLPLIKP